MYDFEFRNWLENIYIDDADDKGLTEKYNWKLIPYWKCLHMARMLYARVWFSILDFGGFLFFPFFFSVSCHWFDFVWVLKTHLSLEPETFWVRFACLLCISLKNKFKWNFGNCTLYAIHMRICLYLWIDAAFLLFICLRIVLFSCIDFHSDIAQIFRFLAFFTSSYAAIQSICVPFHRFAHILNLIKLIAKTSKLM